MAMREKKNTESPNRRNISMTPTVFEHAEVLMKARRRGNNLSGLIADLIIDAHDKLKLKPGAESCVGT